MMLRKKKNPYTILNRKSFLELKMPFKKQQRKTTINAVLEFFRSNKGLDLEQITSATLTKLEEVKARTAKLSSND
ncbi:uncharacterized protein isoform X5 [Castor canadensis]|uniref:Uncharacterized protein isoform X5 n=1 Tax=Castor canadensis TaxID=51338 RepID=A0AC58LZL1_CASCN